jgi:PAS domain S-box-containing protein
VFNQKVKLSLATKIFLGFMVLLLCAVVLAFFSVVQIRNVAKDLRAIKEGHLALARAMAQLETHQQNRFRDLRTGLEERDPKSREVVLRIASEYFPKVIRSAVDEVHKVAEKERATEPGFYDEIVRRIDLIADRHEALSELTGQIVARVQAGEEVRDLAARLAELEGALATEIFQLNREIGDATDRAVRRAELEERNAVWRIVLMTAMALCIGVVLSYLAGRSLAPIHKLAKAISRGDYEQAVEVRGNDEIASLAVELKRMARAQKDREEELDRQAAELERAYRRVEELKRYHESIVRSLRTGVVVTDRRLSVTSTNRAAEAHWGVDPAKVRGRSLGDVESMRPLVDRLGSLKDLLEKSETTHLESLHVGELLADVTVAPPLNEKDEVLGLVVALEDVTEAVRTKEALIRSERLAAIGRMSAHVTHEIRNPLSSIGLNAEMLKDAADGSEAQTLCEAIIREVDRLTAITEEYLKFARLPRPELRPHQIGELLTTIAVFVRRDCEAANVKLVVDVPEGLPSIQIDADQIRQAILNLVRNAKESMPEGGALWLGARREGDAILLFVKDEGAGIPAEALDRIFDPFYSTKLTGTGLGLALCQQIVTEHGAQLRVTSKVGVGSEFAIVLPVPQASEEPQVFERRAHQAPSA